MKYRSQIDKLYPKQREAIFDPRRYSLIEASAQPLDTMVQTPQGPRRFGGLRVGDEVFSIDGDVTKVTGVFPKGKQPVYRLTFTDGVQTRASGDHLWQTRHHRDGERVVTTEDLLRMTKLSRRHFRFPLPAAVAYPKTAVPIDPWLLGVLLGDGSLCGNAISFSTADPEIVERVKRAIPQGYDVRASAEYSWRIVARARGAGYERPSIRWKANGFEIYVARKYVGRAHSMEEALALHAHAVRNYYGNEVPAINLRRELRALGLMGLKHNQKFIPDSYLRNALEVRLEVLRGLMDTDGSAGSGRGAIIEQTSERLAANVQELVHSLGGVCRIAPTPPRQAGWKTSYRANIRHDDIASLFWLPRKKRVVSMQHSLVRTLAKIELIGEDNVQCISVAHPSQLYLTDQYIATHNTKAGKAQPLNALVYTPTGPVPMGDIKIGQRVLTPDGSAKVKAIYPQAGQREVLRVTFSDGSMVETDAEHLWEVHQFRSPPCVVTTEQLQTWPAWRFRRSWVPQIEPAAFIAQSVTVAPYLLGALIGDGGLTRDSVMFSNADEEILSEVRRLIPEGHKLVYREAHDWCITAGAHAAVLREAGTHLRGQIERLGLGGKGSHEKFIPACYRYNSVDVRIGVLQGIFDTDGFVDKHGQPGIEQTSEQLARDIEEVVQSLGGTVLTHLRSINGYRAKDGRFIVGKPVWRQSVRIKDAASLFRLVRKKERCRLRRKSGNRMFRSIEFARRAATQCIQLDDERHLYLTDGLVPTHNTVGCILWLFEQAFEHGRPGRNYWWVAPISDQARIAFRRMLQYVPRNVYSVNLSDRCMTLRNGTLIWFKSADKADSLYGEDVYAAVIDEASRVKEDAWFAIRSTLTYTRGPVRIIGNVKGRRNWFYDLARRAEKGGDPEMGYHKMVAYDAIDAGVLTEAEVEDAKRTLPDHAFRELYLAEPSDDSGNPFGGDDTIDGNLAELSTAAPFVWGWDLAKSVDWTVGVALDRDGQVCDFQRFRAPWGETIARIRRHTKYTQALVDSTGVGDPIVEALSRYEKNYEGYHFSPSSKQKLMEGLSSAIQSKTIRYPAGAITIELKQFEYSYSAHGVRYSAPDNADDDCVMALALAVMHKAHAKPLFRFDEETVRKARQAPDIRRRYA